MSEGSHCRVRIRVGDKELEVEGSESFLAEYFANYWEELKSYGPVKPVLGAGETSAGLMSGRIHQDMSLAEFYKSKNPKKHPDRMLVFYYWLKHHDQKDEASLKEIQECYRLVSIPADANFSQTAGVLSGGSRALLMKGTKKGMYKLTMTGQEYVESGFQLSE